MAPAADGSDGLAREGESELAALALRTAALRQRAAAAGEVPAELILELEQVL
jgi:hypothetical protein